MDIGMNVTLFFYHTLVQHGKQLRKCSKLCRCLGVIMWEFC